MNDHIFSLYMEVINAATSGRYCHGNGVHWCIVDKHGNDVVINTLTGITTVQLVPNPVKPYVNMDIARTLEQFIMNSKADDIWTGVSTSYDDIRYAAQAILWAAENGAVCHFNGGQCYIDTGYGVHIYDTTVRGQIGSTTMGKMASWKYHRANGVNRQTLDKGSLDFFKSLF